MTTSFYSKVLREAAQLNDVGISFSNLRKNTEAIKAFNSAIEKLSDASSSIQSSHDHSMSAEMQSCCTTDTSDAILGQHDDVFYLHRYFIKILPNEAHYTKECEDYFWLCSAIVSFNMALVYHNIGLTTSVELGCGTAIRFYDMSLVLLDKIAVYSETAQQLMLAALNNQSHIHFKQYNKARALQNLKILKEMSSAMDLDDTLSAVIEERDVVEFRRNAIWIDRPCAAACA